MILGWVVFFLIFSYNVFIMFKLLNKLNTAPRVKSKLVLKLEKDGYTKDILEAIRAEREESNNTAKGSSNDGRITVVRVGAHTGN
ncbi:hypothetical protein COR50_06260 [Chitinophaga caeni]|uniref:Uncharacterized protein n=1 Tax=Chitinophaga caeni TaxID=2029983 RepID=A0A291QSF7_9BACT|nr:hypothetical protein [Chitinophaga caeni]ATL46812.1 hypothetical protein COR50_06260 [Chitinophaga caeni]